MNCVFAGTFSPKGGQKGIPGGTEYVRKSINYNNKQGYTHDTHNPTDELQSHTFSATRSKSSKFNTTFTGEVNSLVAKAGLSLEIQIGNDKVVTEQHTWTIPRNSAYTLIYGSRLVKEEGYYNTWFNGEKIESKYIYGHWSYRSYDDMIRKI